MCRYWIAQCRFNKKVPPIGVMPGQFLREEVLVTDWCRRLNDLGIKSLHSCLRDAESKGVRHSIRRKPEARPSRTRLQTWTRRTVDQASSGGPKFCPKAYFHGVRPKRHRVAGIVLRILSSWPLRSHGDSPVVHLDEPLGHTERCSGYLFTRSTWVVQNRQYWRNETKR